MSVEGSFIVTKEKFQKRIHLKLKCHSGIFLLSTIITVQYRILKRKLRSFLMVKSLSIRKMLMFWGVFEWVLFLYTNRILNFDIQLLRKTKYVLNFYAAWNPPEFCLNSLPLLRSFEKVRNSAWFSMIHKFP